MIKEKPSSRFVVVDLKVPIFSRMHFVTFVGI